jgi:hypothetical protein
LNQVIVSSMFWIDCTCTLYKQLLSQLWADILQTLHSCYGHIKDVHATFYSVWTTYYNLCHLHFIHPSIDGTYYGIVSSVYLSVRIMQAGYIGWTTSSKIIQLDILLIKITRGRTLLCFKVTVLALRPSHTAPKALKCMNYEQISSLTRYTRDLRISSIFSDVEPP